MIDVMRSITTAAAIQAPALVDCANSQLAPTSSSLCFGGRNFLAAILCYFSAALKANY
jgi:hypothetical protein